MLPLPPLDISAFSARASVYEGYNDAFLPTSPDGSPAQDQEGRRGSPLTGADASLQFSTSGPTTTHSLVLNGRFFRYTPFSPSAPATGKSALLAYSVTFMPAPTTTVSARESALFGDQDAIHAADTPLTALDLSQGRRQFVLSTTSVSWTREITGADRERATASITLQDTVQDESRISPHTGLEYAAFNLAPGYARDFSGIDSGDFVVNFRAFYQPAAIIDLDGHRGTNTTLQIEPRATWTRTSSASFSRSLFAGISLANTATNGTNAYYVTPTAGAQLTFVEERFTASAGYALGFSPLTALSLPGITNTVTGRVAGEPRQSGFGSHWTVMGTVLGGIGYLPTGSGSIVQTTAGAGATVVIPLLRLLGLYVGYEGRLNQFGGSLGSSVSRTYQNLAYLGITGMLSSEPDAYRLPVPRVQR